MPYDPETAWSDWVRILEVHGRDVFSAVYQARWRAYQEWTNFVSGRALTDVATDLGKTEAEVTDMDTAFAKFETWAAAVDSGAGPVRKFT